MYPVNPKDNCKISLPFGYKYPNSEPYKSWGVAGDVHKGVDIARKDKSGKTVYYIIAPIAGKIINVGEWNPPPQHTDTYLKYVLSHKEGSYVSIDSSSSDKGFRHILLHMYKVFVRPGQIVTKGTVLGIMGKTGMATGIHLHYGVKDTDGAWVDPKPYLT